MSISSSQLSDKLSQMLALVGTLVPGTAVAAAGVEAIKTLFSQTGELNAMLAQVYAETAETAPDVAQAVSEFYAAQGDALEASFKNHPGR